LSTYGSNFKLAAYQSVSVHGGVANADPHAMVLMLMDAAAERIATARGCIERGETARQARLLHSCVNILAELSGSLNMGEGGNLAKNLGDLYEYMLGKIASAGQNGQFRTPRHIIRLMVELTAPTGKDVICDPACGTCGFLVAEISANQAGVCLADFHKGFARLIVRRRYDVETLVWLTVAKDRNVKHKFIVDSVVR